jgi:hypothetical protein
VQEVTTNITPQKLRRVKNDAPASSSPENYLVINHQEVIDTIRKELEKHKKKAGEIRAAVTPDEAEMVATVQIEGTSQWIGVVNSNTKRRPSLLYAGLTSAGSQLCLSRGRMFWHDSRRNWRRSVRQGITALKADIKTFDAQVAALRSREVTPVDADALIMTAFREGLIHHQQIVLINKTVERLADPTALSMFRAFSITVTTGKLITTNPKTTYFDKLLAFKELLEKTS